jgi:hypothetical protein
MHKMSNPLHLNVSRYLTLLGNPSPRAAGQMVPSAGRALGQLGDVGRAHIGQGVDLVH